MFLFVDRMSSVNEVYLVSASTSEEGPGKPTGQTEAPAVGFFAGATTGAGAGAAVGSLFGGFGALPGALIGAGIGGIIGLVAGSAAADGNSRTRK
jgi:hypothetical protein